MNWYKIIITERCWKKRKLIIKKILKASNAPLLEPSLYSTTLNKFAFPHTVALTSKVWFARSICENRVQQTLTKKRSLANQLVKALSKTLLISLPNCVPSWNNSKSLNFSIKIRGRNRRVQFLANREVLRRFFQRNYRIKH